MFDWFQGMTEGVTHDVLSYAEEEQRNGQLADTDETDSMEVVFFEPPVSVHSIILDWTSATFIDSVGAKAIKQVLSFF